MFGNGNLLIISIITSISWPCYR